MKLCLGCMEYYNESASVCPHCSYEENSLPEELFHLVPGTVIGNRYIVGKVLGFGSFGVTYLGFDKQLERKLAIKEYLPSEFATRSLHGTQVTVYSGDKEEQYKQGMNKFVDEARRLAKFNDEEGIVNVYDAFFDNDTAYILMEYLEGESLKSCLERKGKLSVEETEEIFMPILKSLALLHKAGLIHRDIAPDNVFLTKDSKKKLVDFGAARYASAQYSRSLTVMYKPGYAPEEQYQSHGNQGPWTDVYALAATMYKCLTGINPDPSLERKVKDKLKKPSKLGVKISHNKETALMNALNITVESRTKSTESFIEEWQSKGKVERIVERFRNADVGKFGKKAKIALVSGVILLVVALGFVLGMGGITKMQDEIKLGEGNVLVPSVINETVEIAKVITERFGIHIRQSNIRYDDDIPKGMILEQNVEAGLEMPQTDDLLVVVSGGAKQIYMPEVVGMTLDAAIAYLKNEGFTYEIEEKYSGLVKGSVIGTNIETGTPCSPGTQVIIRVSAGLAPLEGGQSATTEYVVEDLTNMTAAELLEKLTDYGIYLDTTMQQESAEIAKNHIISQKTPEGTVLKAGDTLYVVVSSGVPMMNVGDVIGWQFDGKSEELRKKGFEVEIGERVYDMDTAYGVILAVMTENGAPVVDGTELEKGTKLIFKVSDGPMSMPTPVPTMTTTPTNAPTPEPTMTTTPTNAPTPEPTPTKTSTIANVPLKASGKVVTSLTNAQPGDSVLFGSYEQDNDLNNGQEAIEWIVLAEDDDSVLMISKYGLDCEPYNEISEEVTWETCTLRRWLNNEFYNKAFTLEEQKHIKTVTLNMGVLKNYKAGIDLGNDTKDKVFILSYAETADYFRVDANAETTLRSLEPTKYAIAKGCHYLYEHENAFYIGKTLWLLRTPDINNKNVLAVDVGGDVGYGYIVENTRYCERPAIWVKKTAKVKSRSEAGKNQVTLGEVLTPTPTQKLTPTPTISPTPTIKPLEATGKVVNDLAKVQLGDTYIFGSYEQDNDLTNGQEPIEWIVLAKKSDSVLLISKYGLDCEPYNQISEEVTWETCTLRSWLNEEFYNTAFTATEKKQIRTKTLNMGVLKNYKAGIDLGNDTKDKVFILSYAEAVDYFRAAGYEEMELRSIEPTKYAVAKGCHCVYEHENPFYVGKTLWLLRTPDIDNKNVLAVDVGGWVGCGYIVENTRYCERPAIWIKR